MKIFTRADFFLDLSCRAEPDLKREMEVSEWLMRQPGAPDLLAALLSRLAGWQSPDPLDVSRRALFLFASDSALMEEGGLSSGREPSAAESVRLLVQGRHQASRLASLTRTKLVTADLGTPGLESLEGVLHLPVMKEGANNILREDAMTEDSMMMAVRVGMELASQACGNGYQLLCADSLSESSHLASTAVLSSLLNCPPANLLGRDSHLSGPVFERREYLLTEAVSRRSPNRHNAFDVLRKLGSLEIAAMTGFYAGAALFGIPVLIGGGASLTAALILVRLVPETRSLFFAAHAAADPGEERAHRELSMTPVINDRMPIAVKGSALYLTALLDLACAMYHELMGRQEGEID